MIKGEELYPGYTFKAAALFEGIIRLHPFIDGNKRTSLATLQEYLWANGFIFVIPFTAVRFAIVISRNNTLKTNEIRSLVLDIKK
ncbi:Fic family protein [Oxyplasma meridianum]|uniref:Fic family protein n=1 Tax=Oxyplasma meridianum TaxID=3073602 RepID=A0AAX4NFD2_9ARCH